MADNRFAPRQKKTYQVNTITPATVAAGNTFTVTINNISVTFTATAGTVANVTAGLVALLQARTESEFTEITWADATTAITATSAVLGKPFTQTSSAAVGSGGGAPTLVTATSTANTSPEDLNDAVNWTAGNVPAAAENVYIDNVPEYGLKWNLGSLSAVTLTSLNVFSSMEGDIGLPEFDDDAGYRQYRPTYLAIGATTVNIGDNQGNGPDLFKLDSGSVQAAINVYSTGRSREGDKESFLWKGTHASNSLRVLDGEVGVAVHGSETATLLTLSITDGDVRCGPGTTLGTVTQIGGSLETSSAIGTLCEQYDGTHVHRSGTIADLRVNGGTFELNSAAAITLTALRVGPRGTLDLTNCTGTVTLGGTPTFEPGATIIDPGNRLAAGGTFTFSAPGGIGSINLTRGAGSTTVALS